MITTEATGSGAVVQLKSNGTPAAAVTYTCKSSAPTVMGDVSGIQVATSTAVPLTLPKSSDVSTSTLITYTCAPNADAGGLTTTEQAKFDIVILPRAIHALTSQSQGSASGLMLSSGVVIDGSGDINRTLQVYSGVTYVAGDLVALQANLAPTAAVTYVCKSSSPAVLADITGISITATTAVNLVVPRPSVVSAGTLVTYSCSPAEEAGGYTADVGVSFDVFVSPLRMDVVSLASVASAQTNDSIAVGEVLNGTGIATRTPVLIEGAAASNSLVALHPVATVEQAANYSCKSSNEAVLATINNITVTGGSSIPLNIPKVGAVTADTTVTYTCEPAAIVTPAPAATTATESSAATPQAATPAGTTAPATTAAPTTPPVPKATVSVTVRFDVKVQALKATVLAGSNVRRADNLLAFTPGTDISGGATASKTPVVMYNETTTSGAVAQLRLNAAPEVEVTFNCKSSDATILADIPDIKVSSTAAVNLLVPVPGGVLTGDKTITYTCAPAAAAGGLLTTDSVKFDVLVHYYGLLVLAGSSARNSANLSSIAAGTNVGYTSSAALTPLVIMEAGSSTTLQMRAKAMANVTTNGITTETVVDVNCVSSDPTVLADFPVPSVALDNSTAAGIQAKAMDLPASALLAEDKTVTYTCSVECPKAPYVGNESVKFDVKVMARGLIPVAGSSAGTSRNLTTAIPAGALLTTGSETTTPSVFELDASSDNIVSLFTTVPPTADVTVTCTSSNPDVLASVTGIKITSSSGLVGGTAVKVTVPASKATSTDVTVVYTCAPVASSGGYTSQEAKFDIFVRKQGLQFVTGSRAIAMDATGTMVPTGSAVTSMRAVEGVQYGVGELVGIKALDSSTTVTCDIEVPEGSPQLSGPVLASAGATSGDISVSSGSITGLYLPRMPSVTGDAVKLTLKCMPKTAGSGYETTDETTVEIVVEDLFTPPALPDPTIPQAKFTVDLTFKAEPSAEVLAAVQAEVQKVTSSRLGVNLDDVIVQTATSRRRAILSVRACPS